MERGVWQSSDGEEKDVGSISLLSLVEPVLPSHMRQEGGATCCWPRSSEAVEGQRRREEAEKKASSSSAFFNLSNCAVGAGIVGVPFAFEALGVMLALVVYAVMAVAAMYSLHILALSSEATGMWPDSPPSLRHLGARHRFVRTWDWRSERCSLEQGIMRDGGTGWAF